MQETPTTQYLRLRVWALTVGFAASAFVVGILALPAHLLKAAHAHQMMGGPFGPGERPWPLPSGIQLPPGMPPGPGPHDTLFFVHHEPSIAIAIFGLLAVTVVAGIAGAIIAAVYNALLPKQ